MDFILKRRFPVERRKHIFMCLIPDAAVLLPLSALPPLLPLPPNPLLFCYSTLDPRLQD